MGENTSIECGVAFTWQGKAASFHGRRIPIPEDVGEIYFLCLESPKNQGQDD